MLKRPYNAKRITAFPNRDTQRSYSGCMSCLGTHALLEKWACATNHEASATSARMVICPACFLCAHFRIFDDLERRSGAHTQLLSREYRTPVTRISSALTFATQITPDDHPFYPVPTDPFVIRHGPSECHRIWRCHGSHNYKCRR